MDRSKGFIYIWRDLQNHWIWNKRPYSEGQAWIDLIMLANHEDIETFKDGHVQSFRKGTVNRSILSLSERWGWDRKKTRHFLKILEIEKMATTESTTRGTTITLMNYELFQNQGTTKRTTKGTTPPPTVGQLLPTNNNDNNDNNEIKREIVRHKYGDYKNVLLSDEELKKLQTDYPSMWNDKLEALSNYMKSTGRTYKDHFATIRNWIKKDLKEGGEAHGENNSGEKGKTFNLEDFIS